MERGNKKEDSKQCKVGEGIKRRVSIVTNNEYRLSNIESRFSPHMGAL